MAYDKHTWNTKEAITKSKMQNIEDGIAALDTQQTTNTQDISTLNTKLGEISVNQGGTVAQRLSNLSSDIVTLQNAVGSQSSVTSRLESVETAITNAKGSSDTLQKELMRIENESKQRDTTLTNNVSTATSKADAAQTTANNAIGAIDAAKGTSNSLQERIDGIADINLSQNTAIGTLQGRLNNPTGDNKTMEQNFSIIYSDVGGIKSEIQTARGVDNLNEPRENLNARFVDDEARLTSAEGRLTSLETSTGTTLPTRIGAVESRIGTAEGKITAIETEINGAHREGIVDDTLDARFDAVEATANAAAVAATVNTALDGLDGRLDAIDGGSALDTTNGTLASRVSAAESAISHAVDAGNSDPGGLTERLTAAETAIGTKANSSDMETALAAKANASEVNTALATKADATTVNAISTTIVKAKTDVAYTEGIPSTTQTWTINDKDDYLLQAADDKYYYWKHINNEWHLMGGAGNGEGGGTGNSNSEDYASYSLFEQAEKELNKDYYVLQDGFYHHYRYLATGANDEPIEIGTVINNNNIKQYRIQGYTDTETNKNYIDLYQFNYGINNTEMSEGTRIDRIELVGGGGGGGTFNTKQLTRITPRNRKWPINSDEKIYLRFFYTNGTANESDKFVLTQSNTTMTATTIMGGGDETIISGDPANASNTWPTKEDVVDGETVIIPKEQSECETGFYQFDVTDYCKTLGKQTFVLTVTDQDDPSIYTTMTWEITLINLMIESDFTENSILPLGQAINFTYTPSGDINKVAHFYLGNTEIGTQSLNARTVDEQTYTIPGRNIEGAYQLRVYLSAVDNGNNIYSESIYRDLIWRNDNSDTLILSSPYRERTIDVQQYNAIEIPYTIAGNNNTYVVKYYVNDFTTPYNEVTLNNTNHAIWTYRPLTKGTQNLRIAVDDSYISITLNVIENVVDIAPYTTNLVLNFDPTGLSNNSNSAKNWTNGTYHLTTSENFDWFNGGYGSDSTGEYFLIKSGTRAYFDYKMFMQDSEEITSQDNQTVTIPTSKVYKTGQEIKLIFKTSAVRTIDAVWFTNMARYDANIDTEVGIQLSAHEGCLKTDTAGVVVGDDEAVTNTYLYFPYSEEDRIELDININKEDSVNGAITMSYEDGVPSKAYAYTHNQKLYHAPNNEAVITIGSDDCDVYIYKLKIYNQELTPAQVLRNFIADGKDVDESIRRYERNCIYYDVEHDVYSPYATSGFELNPEAIASKIPNVKVLMLDAPTFTKNKKSFIKNSSLRCIHADGGTIYKSRGAADNWLFENGYHAGQGTTSDKYGDSGRNIDFLFNSDGIHQPSDKVKTIDPNYISRVTTGYGSDSPVVSTVHDWMGPENEGKVSLTSTSIPNNFFNFKVNIASSENVNNAMLQKRYNDFLPYLSPAKNRDSRIKNDMEFVPAILFVRENSDNLVDHMEFGDTNWHFYALGNLGDSKKTDYTRAYDPTDMNEFTLEISDNNTNNSQFQTGVYMVNGQPTLEEFEIVQDTEDDGVTLIEDSYTAQGRSGAIATTDYVYPLDTPALKALWNATDPQTGEYTNKNHWSLVNEPYDGDHSFEMRYACQGNYRDGKLVNDTHGKITVNGSEVSKDKYQLKVNARVWQAFYSWVVTASNSEFINNLDQWCVRSAVEFWYAFTHYYTMMDNRAKNTFWHFGKTGKHRRVIEPLKDMLHTYDESADASLEDDGSYSGTFTRTTDTEVNSNKTYYTEYAFDLWDYDNDTALGINNNGELIFPYGKEDSDYTIADNPASGYVFNGAGSVFWRRLRDLCTSEISSIFNTVREEFFSAENLIDQFDNFQNCYPEALWQVDIQRKYIRPFIKDMGKNLPNDGHEFLTRKDENFLKTMMQGRKKYQRRQWIRDQYYYFGSKYKLNNITEDFFLLDCWTGPDDTLIRELKAQGRDEEAAQYVGSNWDITITPYQDMYINASFGETAKTPVRAKAGQPIEMICPFPAMNNTRIYIYGASRLSALAGKAKREDPNDPEKITGAEGLASLYFGYNRLQKADKLQHLYIGTDKTTYRNANLVDLSLNENSPILETLDIRNCSYLTGELKVGGCNNLRVLKAEGTNINLVTLPTSSQITTLHLPSTITSLSLSAARKLTDFYMKNKTTQLEDYSNLRSLIIDSSDESASVNWMSIAKTCINNLNYLYLLNLKTSSIINMDELEPFKTRKEDIGNINLSGTINVTGSWSTIEVDEYKRVWNNNINFVTNPANVVTRYKITYKYDDYIDDNGNVVEGDEIATKYVRSGTRIPDIVYTNEIDTPTRASTVRYDFTFGVVNYDNYVENSGWKAVDSDTPFNEMPLASGNMTIETYFTPSTRRYPVKWYMRRNDDSTLVKTSSNQEEYGAGYDLEAPTVQEIHNAGQPTIDINISNGVATYSIFEGWETLPTNIHPAATDTSYNIYAKWSTPASLALSEIFADTTNLTPEQLLVYSHISSSDRNLYVDTTKIDEGKRITVTMGHDSSEEGTILVASDSILRLDLNPRATKTNIQPMTAENDAFTIMVDYNLSANANYDSSKTAAILMSCYYQNSNNDVISGFAVYDSLKGSAIGPRVGFGDMFNNTNYSVPIGGKSVYHDVRNVIVLRHPAGSEKLYIYSGLNTNNKITSNIEVQTITWNNSTNNAYINFGQLTDSTDPEYDNLKDNLTTARGIIYQAKYWNQDLGVGECKRLASWPHETIMFGISKINNNASSGQPGDNNPSPSLCLNTLTGTNYGHLVEDSSSMSWGESTYRTILNTHVIQGLPTKLQAILNKPKVKYLPLVTTTDPISQAQTTTLSDNTLSQNDYLFFPSIYNISSTNSTYSSETSNMSYEKAPYPWIRSSNVTVYDYNPTATNGHWNVSTDSEAMRYMNLRFSIKPIGQTIRVFRETSNSFSTGNTTTIYNEILTVVSSITVGDIFIDVTGHAYMYIANTDINNLGAQVQPNSGIFACPASPGGGWISSSGFATRSMMTPDSWSTNNKHFIYSNDSGTVVTAYSSNNSISGNIGLGLNYSFTI